MTQNLRQWVADVEKGSADSIKSAVHKGQIQGGEIRLGVCGNEDPMYVLDGVPFLASTYDEAWKLMEFQHPSFRNIKGLLCQGAGERSRRLQGQEDPHLLVGDSAHGHAARLPGDDPALVEIPQSFCSGLIEALFTSAQTGSDIQATPSTSPMPQAP